MRWEPYTWKERMGDGDWKGNAAGEGLASKNILPARNTATIWYRGAERDLHRRQTERKKAEGESETSPGEMRDSRPFGGGGRHPASRRGSRRPRPRSRSPCGLRNGRVRGEGNRGTRIASPATPRGSRRPAGETGKSPHSVDRRFEFVKGRAPGVEGSDEEPDDQRDVLPLSVRRQDDADPRRLGGRGSDSAGAVPGH